MRVGVIERSGVNPRGSSATTSRVCTSLPVVGLCSAFDMMRICPIVRGSGDAAVCRVCVENGVGVGIRRGGAGKEVVLLLVSLSGVFEPVAEPIVVAFMTVRVWFDVRLGSVAATRWCSGLFSGFKGRGRTSELLGLSSCELVKEVPCLRGVFAIEAGVRLISWCDDKGWLRKKMICNVCGKPVSWWWLVEEVSSVDYELLISYSNAATAASNLVVGLAFADSGNGSGMFTAGAWNVDSVEVAVEGVVRGADRRWS